MARFDPYIDAEYYQARSTKGRELDESLTHDIASAQALLDRELGVVDGAFNEYDSASVTLDSFGGDMLWLRESSGRAFFLRAVAEDGIGIDTERDGTFDGVTMDLGVPAVDGINYVENSDGIAYIALRLLPGGGLRQWPKGPSSVRITGDFGFPGGPPDAIKAVLYSITRELRDHFSAGSANRQQWAGDEAPLSDQTWRQIGRIKTQFGRAVPIS